MPQKLPNNELAKGINSLNSKQREVFNVVHICDKNYGTCDWHNVEPGHIFLSGRGGISKSHLVKVIYNATSKTFSIIVRTLRSQEFFYLKL